MIYFDNAATSKQKPQIVIDAVVDAMQNFGNSSRGVYEESLSADRIVYQTRKKLASLFNAKNPRQVAFSKNSTESLNIAIKGLINSQDHIITSVSEHNSVLRPINYLKQNGLDVDYLNLDESYNIKIEDIQNLIKQNTKAVIITHASNVTGNITNLKKVGELCKKNNLILIVDASQTAGAFEIDMQEWNISALCFTGHKSLYAPQGVGGIVLNKNLHIKPFIVGGTGSHSYDLFQPDKMPTLLEAGTLNSHGIAGLNAALDYISQNKMNKLTSKACYLAKRFYDGVKNLDSIKFYGDFETDYRAPIIPINIGNVDSSEISSILSSKYNIATRPGAHCAPLIHKAMGTVDQGIVRFSFSHTNNEKEIDFAIHAIKEIIAKYNK